MELVEGASPNARRAFDDARHLASQVTAALEYAYDYDKGVIHRHLKPGNVKVSGRHLKPSSSHAFLEAGF